MFFLALPVILLPLLAQANECDEYCKLEAVSAHFTALVKVAKQGSSIDDIDALFSLTHDKVM